MASTITNHKDDREVRRLLREMGVDIAEIPPIMTNDEAAGWLGIPRLSLQQDRVGGNPTVPYCKIGRRVRYLRGDIARFLLSTRVGGVVDAS